MPDYQTLYRDLIAFADAEGLTLSCAAYVQGMRAGFERRSLSSGSPPGYLGDSYARGHSHGLSALIGSVKAVKAR